MYLPVIFLFLFPVTEKLCDAFSIVRYQVGELNSADKASRELYYQCVQDVIHQAILLFPIYVQHASKKRSFNSLIIQYIFICVYMYLFVSNFVGFLLIGHMSVRSNMLNFVVGKLMMWKYLEYFKVI